MPFSGRKLYSRMKMLGYQPDHIVSKANGEVSARSVKNWMSGENCPSANHVELLARVLRAPIQYFYDGVDDQGNPLAKEGSNESDLFKESTDKPV